MSQQICDRMGFACAGRPLNQHCIVLLNPAGNVQLFFIRLLRQQNIDALAANGCKLFVNGFFSCVLRQFLYPAADNIPDWAGYFSGLLYIFNDLLDGFQSAVQTLPDDEAGIQVEKQPAAVLPVCWNAAFRICAVR